MKKPSPLTYHQSGVDYSRLDQFKRFCQESAQSTLGVLPALGVSEPRGVRGESCYLLEGPDAYYAHVEEGLGTKNLVADAVQAATGECFYKAIGYDTVATIVNDMVTLGAQPLSVAMHAAVGDGTWFDDSTRCRELAEGFAQGCRDAGSVWGGGETPALKGIVEPGAMVLAGSAFGWIRPKTRLIPAKVRDGDRIVFVESSGIHTNGLTLCRAISDRLEQGFQTPLPTGQTYGQALLAPSVIYVRLVMECLNAGILPGYTVHITGHGWRKLMRLAQPMVYRIETPCPVPPLFAFLQKHSGLDLREMYGTFNMGAGFALFVTRDESPMVVDIAASLGLKAWDAGTILENAGRKAVEIPDIGVTYDAGDLQVR